MYCRYLKIVMNEQIFCMEIHCIVLAQILYTEINYIYAQITLRVYLPTDLRGLNVLGLPASNHWQCTFYIWNVVYVECTFKLFGMKKDSVMKFSVVLVHTQKINCMYAKITPRVHLQRKYQCQSNTTDHRGLKVLLRSLM
jgi:hypothetical protein